MASKAESNSVDPKVFVGIATGPAKEYALHQMIASLRHLNYDNLHIHWSTTHFGNKLSTVYRKRLVQVMGTVDWSNGWHVHTTYIRGNDYVDNTRRNPRKPEVTSYYDPVIRNLRKLRGEFLDGDCDYFLELGGDNPPLRDTVQRLMDLDVDVAFLVCYGRPRDDADKMRGLPLVFVYSWTLDELERFQLDPYLQGKFRLAWANTPMMLPLAVVPNWKRKHFLTEFAAGTGCVLIKRRVLERVGWHLPPSRYFSEDLYFCHQCRLHGFSMKLDLRHHCPHFHEDGLAY